MSKELEALNKIQHDFGQLKGQELVKCYETIFNGLKRLEAIDNANPSEALKELDEIIEYITEDKKVKYKATILFDCEIIKDALIKEQEQEKVLEIERKSSMVAQEILGDYAILKKQYCKVVDELLEKERVLDGYKDLEEEIGCPLEVVFKLVNQNELYYQFYNELQHWTSVKVDLRKKVVWYCKQVGGHYACSQPLSNYGKTFWLREDKSE